jgi:nitroreductase
MLPPSRRAEPPRRHLTAEGELMATLALDPDRLLTTTRAVRRRLDFDRPVERSVIEECLAIALQAPTGGNQQRWHFVVVTDAAKR